MKYVFLTAACLMLMMVAAAQQTTDGELFAEGRIALDQHNDCARARRAFESESKAAQDSPVWLDYAARASECVGDLDAALRYYELELGQMPGTGRLINKVGELKYQTQVRRDKAIANGDLATLQETVEFIRSELSQEKRFIKPEISDIPGVKGGVYYAVFTVFYMLRSFSVENGILRSEESCTYTAGWEPLGRGAGKPEVQLSGTGERRIVANLSQVDLRDAPTRSSGIIQLRGNNPPAVTVSDSCRPKSFPRDRFSIDGDDPMTFSYTFEIMPTGISKPIQIHLRHSFRRLVQLAGGTPTRF